MLKSLVYLDTLTVFESVYPGKCWCGLMLHPSDRARYQNIISIVMSLLWLIAYSIAISDPDRDIDFVDIVTYVSPGKIVYFLC